VIDDVEEGKNKKWLLILNVSNMRLKAIGLDLLGAFLQAKGGQIDNKLMTNIVIRKIPRIKVRIDP